MGSVFKLYSYRGAEFAAAVFSGFQPGEHHEQNRQHPGGDAGHVPKQAIQIKAEGSGPAA